MDTLDMFEQACPIISDPGRCMPQPPSIVEELTRAADNVMSELIKTDSLMGTQPSRLVRLILETYARDMIHRGQKCPPCEMVFAAREMIDPTLDNLEVTDPRREKYELTVDSMLKGSVAIRACEVAGASGFTECYANIATLLAYVAMNLPR